MYQYTKSIFLSISDTSLCIIGSGFVHLIRNDSNTFLFMAEQYSIVYMYYSFFIHSSVDGHLGCFHVLAIVNSAVIDTGVHKSFSILVSSGYMPWGSISGSYDDFIPSFQRNLHIIFHSGCINLHFCQQCTQPGNLDKPLVQPYPQGADSTIKRNHELPAYRKGTPKH